MQERPAASHRPGDRRRIRLEPVVDKLNAEVNRIVGTPALQEKFLLMGVDPLIASPARFGEILENDAARWGKTVKEAGVTAN